MLIALMSNEFAVIWMMVSLSLMEVRMTKEMMVCMGVADKNERYGGYDGGFL